MARTLALTLSSVALVFAALQSTVAYGDDLYSPPLSTATSGVSIQCAIQNIGNTLTSVTIRAYRSSTVSVDTVVSIGAGAAASAVPLTCQGGACDKVRCDFYTTEKKAQFRASACLQGLPNGGMVCLPAE